MKDKIRKHYNELAIEFHKAYILGDDEYLMYLSAMIDALVRECNLFAFNDILSEISEELDMVQDCMENVFSGKECN